MKPSIAFFLPPQEQRVGGLDFAVSELADAVRELGLTVEVDPSVVSGFDIAHLHGLWQPRYQQIARSCRAQRIPYVVSPHGMLEPWAWKHRRWKKWPYFHLVEKELVNLSDRILATSVLEAENLAKFRFRPRIVTLPLGANPPAQPDYTAARIRLDWQSDEFVLLYLSRLHPKKGLHILLSALAELNLRRIDLRLVIVGDGPPDYVRQVKASAATLASRLPRIDWVGPIWDERKWDYLQGADLFCLPTHSENFGLAILESCQVGTPVLTTIATPWGEFLARHGLPVIVPTQPALLEGLAKSIGSRGFGMPERERLASEARKEFSWSSLGPRYATFYRAMVQG